MFSSFFILPSFFNFLNYLKYKNNWNNKEKLKFDKETLTYKKV